MTAADRSEPAADPPQLPDARSPRLAVAALVALVLLFGARLLHTAERNTLTIDEPHYMATGLYLWKTRDYSPLSVLRAHPPLAFHLASVPLLFLDLRDLEPHPYLGFDLMGGAEPPPRTFRLVSRLPFVLLTCWGAVLVFLWAREAAGTAAGLLATTLYTTAPMLLGHGPLVHSDITVSVFFLQALYTYWRWLRWPTNGRLVLCGLSLGLALLSKMSAVLLLPTIGLFAIGIATGRISAHAVGVSLGPTGPHGSLALGLRRYAGMMAVALFVVWVGYSGSFAWERSQGGPFEGWLLPGYLAVLQWDAIANSVPRDIFFFGELGPGRWYVLPVAFLIKTPLATLLLLLLASTVRRPARGAGPLLGIAIAVYAIAACFLLRIPLGLRYALPIFPLLFVFIGTRLAPALSTWRGPIVAASLAWLALAGLSIHPHYISYFNETVGGPERGHRYLVGSYLDWGQDLGALARLLEERGNPPVHLAYDGPEKPGRYGLNAVRVQTCEPAAGLVAANVSLLRGQGSFPGDFQPVPAGCFDWLLDHDPIARAGYSILLFEIPTEPAGSDRGASR